MNEFVRGFRSQSRIRGCHREDVEIDIKIKRSRFCLPVLAMLKANVRERSNTGNARDYVWALCEWLGPSRKDPDRLDPHRCIEPDGGNVRTTGWLESTPFQQHGGWPWPRERVCGSSDELVGSCRLARTSYARLTWHRGLSQAPLHPLLPSLSPRTRLSLRFSLNLKLAVGHGNDDNADGHPNFLATGEIYD